MTVKGEVDLARLIEGANAGREGAVDALSEAIHEHLRAMARRHLVRDFGPAMAGVTIQPTVLANDTLMKLIRQRQQFDNAGHFFAIASRLMMRVLLDYHRERKAAKRGGSVIRVPLGPEHAAGIADPDSGRDVDAEAVDAVLENCHGSTPARPTSSGTTSSGASPTVRRPRPSGLRLPRSSGTGRSPRRGWPRSCRARADAD